jgi:iron complex outermembrane recepter protein
MRVKSPVFFRRLGIFLGPFLPRLAVNQAGKNLRPAGWAGEVFMNRFRPFVLSLILLALTPFSSFAQEKEITLEEVVVTATRDAEEIRKIPANVTVIPQEEIERSYTQTTADLLRSEVGVVVNDLSGTGKNNFIDIRGFGEIGNQNVLVLVDGRRINAIDLSAIDWTQIPQEQIERIEVLRGAGSVLYGDNAVAGVINIITKRPQKPFSFEAGASAGSYHYNNETASISGKSGPFSAILNTDYHATDGYRDNGFLRAKDAGGKFIYDMDDRLSFNLSGNFHKDDAGLPGNLTKDQIHILGRRATVAPFDSAETDDMYGALGMNAKLGSPGRIEAELSYRHREVSTFYFDPLSQPTYDDRRNLATWGFTPRYFLEMPVWNHANKLTFGVDLYNSSSKIFYDLASAIPEQMHNQSEVEKKSAGIYLLDEFSILENLLLSLGYRHEWVTFDLSQEIPSFDEKVRDDTYAWNAGLTYFYDRKSSAFLSVKRSFRFPTTDELIEVIFNPNNFFEVKEVRVNPNVKTQTGLQYEAGIRHAVTDRSEVNVTFFRIDTEDEIFFNPVTFNNENYPKTRRLGVEAGAASRPWQWLNLWGNYSYVRARLRTGPFSGNVIPFVPKHKGSAGADVHFGRGFLFDTRFNYVGSRYLISDFENIAKRLDWYYTVDTRLSYAYKGLKAFAGINNLFNRKYEEFGSFVGGTRYFSPSPERNYMAGVSYSF